tara:strand:+ start:144 stop:425 length:282 start_codon:yes stop_codon:yes gene_type:complete
MQVFKLNAKMKIRMFKYYSKNLINLEKQKVILLDLLRVESNSYNLGGIGQVSQITLNNFDDLINKIDTYNYRLKELKNNTWGNTNSRDKKGLK